MKSILTMFIIKFRGFVMKRIKAVFLAMLVTTTLVAAQSGWKMDQAHSSIFFTVRHMIISEVTGSFKDFSLTLNSTKDNFSDASVEGTIQVASINTDNNFRDKHLKSDDFFNAEKFPEIKFKSTTFEKIDVNKYKITGDLTIRDVTKKVTFDAVLIGIVNAQGKRTRMESNYNNKSFRL